MSSRSKPTKTASAVSKSKATQLMVPISSAAGKLATSKTIRSSARTKVSPKGLIESLNLTDENILAITNLATSFSKTAKIDQKDLEDGTELDRKSVKKKTEVVLGTKTDKIWVRAHIEKNFHRKAESGSRGKDGEEEEESDQPETEETEEEDDCQVVEGPMNSTVYESFQE